MSGAGSGNGVVGRIVAMGTRGWGVLGLSGLWGVRGSAGLCALSFATTAWTIADKSTARAGDAVSIAANGASRRYFFTVSLPHLPNN